MGSVHHNIDTGGKVKSFGKSNTIEDRLVLTGGRSTGFDYMRIVLAISIVAYHTIVASYGWAAQIAANQSPFRPLIASILLLFFALSGFLVAGSLVRTPALTKFLGLRALRIFPALAVETVLMAILIGPILSEFNIRTYYSDPLFYQYLMNVAGVIHYKLPGVFLSNPWPGVINGQLWTVPYELGCYISLAVIALSGIVKKPYILLASIFAIGIALCAWRILKHHGIPPPDYGPVTGYVLVLTFLAGVATYLLRDGIPYSRPLFIFAVAFITIALYTPLGDDLVAIPAAYVTVYLGLQNPKATALHKLGDMSYGIFLFGAPIQQIVAGLGAWAQHWYINLLIALPLVAIFAWFSWNFIEKPALSLRRHLYILQPVDDYLDRLKAFAKT
jgi:peptidoglycan/LPS O-acetylase OafA/YrhL